MDSGTKRQVAWKGIGRKTHANRTCRPCSAVATPNNREMRKALLWHQRNLRSIRWLVTNHENQAMISDQVQVFRKIYLSDSQWLWHINNNKCIHPQHVPIKCSFWNEAAMTTVHKCSTFHRVCSTKEKAQKNTVYSTGWLSPCCKDH